MQDADRGGRFKTFTDSFRIIGKLGQQLAILRADVDAIESLPVDDYGNAEATINVNNSRSLHMLRIPPSAMLLAKRGEVARAMDALKAEFSEILDHAEVLQRRCKPHLPAELAEPRKVTDLHTLDWMARDMQHEIEAVPPQHQPSHIAKRNRPLAPPLRSRIAQGGAAPSLPRT
jgi:hypothetical protein